MVKGTMMGGSTIPIVPMLYPTNVIALPDRDNDGVPDKYDPQPDSSNDFDFDGWSDDFENVTSGTNWGNPDTDGDGVADRSDLAPLDPEISLTIPLSKLPRIQGLDNAHIFIDTDTDPTTGYHTTWMPIGAEYMVEVSGKYGKILKRSLQKFDGGTNDEWRWEFIKEVKVGTDANRLETQVNIQDLIDSENGTDISNATNIDIFYHITDWSNMTEDRSDFILNNVDGIKETPKSITVLNPNTDSNGYDWTVNFITSGIGKIRIGNGSFPHEVDFKGLYYFDLKTEKYVPVNVDINVTDQTITAAWRYKLGKIVITPRDLGGNYTIELIYGDTVYAYYNNNGTQNITGDEDNGSGRATGEPLGNVPQVWRSRNPQGTDVVINEIYPGKKDNEWIELYNPTSGTIDISGWSITTLKGFYTFPGAPGSSTTTLGPGQFLVIDNTDFGNDFLKASDTVILQNATSVIIDQTTYKGIANGQSWARFAPNGFDTDQDSDWYKETTPTMGTSNTTLIPEYDYLFLPLLFLSILCLSLKRKHKRNKRNLE
jgi:hypothetical protein